MNEQTQNGVVALSNDDKTPAQKALEALAKKREARKAESQNKRDEQEVIDRTAIEELLLEHGDNNISIIEVDGFVPGVPVVAAVRNPSGSGHYARYTSMIRMAKDDQVARGKACDLLGEASIVYPTDSPDGPKTLTAMKKAFNGLVASAYHEAVRLAELRREEEKKR